MKNDIVNILVDTNYNIKYIESLPERLAHSCIYEYDAMYCQSCYEYEQALHQAKANAIDIGNPDDVKAYIKNYHVNLSHDHQFISDFIYPLEGYEVDIDNGVAYIKPIQKKGHKFCEKPELNCSMNYCDDNGCMERKRVLAEPTEEEIKNELWQAVDRTKELSEIKLLRQLTHEEDLELQNLQVKKMNLWSEWKDPK